MWRLRYKVWLVCLPLLLSMKGPQERWTIEVLNAANSEGKIRIGVYKDASTFPNETKQFVGLVQEIKNGKSSFIVELPIGSSYAFAAYHDENNNGILDKNLLGMPLERYGFSNDAREMFSSPEFSSAEVRSPPIDKLTITLQ